MPTHDDIANAFALYEMGEGQRERLAEVERANAARQQEDAERWLAALALLRDEVRDSGDLLTELRPCEARLLGVGHLRELRLAARRVLELAGVEVEEAELRAAWEEVP